MFNYTHVSLLDITYISAVCFVIFFMFGFFRGLTHKEGFKNGLLYGYVAGVIITGVPLISFYLGRNTFISGLTYLVVFWIVSISALILIKIFLRLVKQYLRHVKENLNI